MDVPAISARMLSLLGPMACPYEPGKRTPSRPRGSLAILVRVPSVARALRSNLRPALGLIGLDASLLCLGDGRREAAQRAALGCQLSRFGISELGPRRLGAS